MINMSIEGWLSKGGYANHGSRSCHEHPWLEFASDRPRTSTELLRIPTIVHSWREVSWRISFSSRSPHNFAIERIESTMAARILPYSATSRVISSSGSRSHLVQPPCRGLTLPFPSLPLVVVLPLYCFFSCSTSFRSSASLLSRVFAIVRPGPLLAREIIWS